MATNTDDYELVLRLASASLDRSPKSNWVEESGELPAYVRKIALSVEKTGKTLSASIAIAISRIKVWSAGGDGVDASTKAKALSALAAWEALKAKNKAGNLVKASRHDDSEYLMLSYIPSFDTRTITRSFEQLEQSRRKAYELEHELTSPSRSPYETTEIAPYDGYPYRYPKEVWTDYILVENESADKPALVKIPFTVHPLTKQVTFGGEIPVKTIYVEMNPELTPMELRLLSNILE